MVGLALITSTNTLHTMAISDTISFPFKGSHMFKIEESIPIPREKVGGGRPAVYPFNDMKIGDSFAAPSEVGKSAMNAARSWAHRHPGWSCVCRTQPNGTVRIWRTA